MSPFSPSRAVRADPVEPSITSGTGPASCDRRRWLRPTLVSHSTLTVVTQANLPMPLNLLFLQLSKSQCIGSDGEHVPC